MNFETLSTALIELATTIGLKLIYAILVTFVGLKMIKWLKKKLPVRQTLKNGLLRVLETP